MAVKMCLSSPALKRAGGAGTGVLRERREGEGGGPNLFAREGSYVSMPRRVSFAEKCSSHFRGPSRGDVR